MLNKPDIILQLHRMGDLVLTFPLAQKMKEKDPSRPLWIAAEEGFYSSLLNIAPNVVFIPPKADILKNTEFRKIINLSQRHEAAELAGQMQGELFIGPVAKAEKKVIHGFWELYRASLVNNSRHNLFHWSDLNCLNDLTIDEIGTIPFAYPHRAKKTGRVGLFVGASAEGKRPNPKFYGNLAKKLLSVGLKPVFLGGKDEIALGTEAAWIANAPAMNLCGHFSLSQLIYFFNELDLLVTPDTGPMHVAAAFGTPTLCLAMGNVVPEETSAASPNHLILQGNMSCLGCWDCYRNQQCKNIFTPYKVAQAIMTILSGEQSLPKLQGLKYLRTGRKNLHYIEEIGQQIPSARKEISLYWKSSFIHMSQNIPCSFDNHFTHFPQYIPLIQKEKLILTKELSHCLKNKSPLSKNSWQEKKPLIRPLTSFLQLYLENHDYSLPSFQQVFNYLEK